MAYARLVAAVLAKRIAIAEADGAEVVKVFENRSIVLQRHGVEDVEALGFAEASGGEGFQPAADYAIEVLFVLLSHKCLHTVRPGLLSVSLSAPAQGCRLPCFWSM